MTYCARISLFLLAVASSASQDVRTRSGAKVAIIDVTVVDVQTAENRPHMDVILDRERISSVAPTGRKAPNTATIIDGKTHFLLPGLWDMHIHVAGDSRALGLLLAAGITGARDMGGEPKIVMDSRKRSQAVDFEGPRLIVAGPMLAGPHAEPNEDTWVINSPEQATEAVTRLAGIGVDFIKVHDHLSLESYRAIASTAKSKSLPFAGHVSEYVSPAEASNLGQKSIEHFEFLPKECGGLLGPDRSAIPPNCEDEAMYGLMKRFAKNGTWLDPTVGAFRYFAPDQWAAINSAFKSLANLMRRARVKVMAGTDQSGYLESKGSIPGQSLHDELILFVHAGFSAQEALWAATGAPADFLGESGSAGTIATGKMADLVLLDADPLHDIANINRVAMVIKRGHVFDSRDLTRLRSRQP